MPLSTFLKFYTNLEEDSVRSFQNVLNKCSRVLILVFLRSGIFINSTVSSTTMAGLQCHAIKNKNHNHSVN